MDRVARSLREAIADRQRRPTRPPGAWRSWPRRSAAPLRPEPAAARHRLRSIVTDMMAASPAPRRCAWFWILPPPSSSARCCLRSPPRPPLPAASSSAPIRSFRPVRCSCSGRAAGWSTTPQPSPLGSASSWPRCMRLRNPADPRHQLEVNGNERRPTGLSPRWALWTRTARPRHRGHALGRAAERGLRHPGAALGGAGQDHHAGEPAAAARPRGGAWSSTARSASRWRSTSTIAWSRAARCWWWTTIWASP